MRFEEKHRYQVKNHLLSGITFPKLCKIFKRYYKDIEWIYYLHRILFLVCISIFNSSVSLVESLLFDDKIRRTKIHPEPVFILGHPRTGTTHIHNLLALDRNRFAYCSTFQAGFPNTFLCLERWKEVLAPIMDKTRPMDAMKLDFDLPQEDEIATNAISGGISPYLQIVIMKSFNIFKPYFSFEEDCPPSDKEAWEESFMFFLKKLTFRHGHKPLLIKSPVHTARVKLLLRHFPRAKFIYIHRSPYEVFQSACHMADTYYWFCYLNRPSRKDILDFIILQYQLLYHKYVDNRGLIAAGSLEEVSFADLERDPGSLLRALYHKFGWSGYDSDRVEQYLGSLSDFKKNAHKPLDEESRKLVQEQWRESFETFGYQL